MKYVILLLDTEVARNMTEAEGQAWYAEIGAWYEKGGGGSGKLVEGGHQLAPPATAKTVRASGVTLDRFCGSGITANNAVQLYKDFAAALPTALSAPIMAAIMPRWSTGGDRRSARPTTVVVKRS